MTIKVTGDIIDVIKIEEKIRMKLTTNIPKERLLFVENGPETMAYRKGDKVELTRKHGKGRSRETIAGTIHKINDASIEFDTCGLGALAIIMFNEIAEIKWIA